MEVSLLDIGLRTHEILENALQFQLTGEDDYGSGTTLATVTANIAGTEELLDGAAPAAGVQVPGLPQVYAGLTAAAALLQGQRHANGSWTPVSRLTTAAREQIDAATGQLLQDLAPDRSDHRAEEDLTGPDRTPATPPTPRRQRPRRRRPARGERSCAVRSAPGGRRGGGGRRGRLRPAHAAACTGRGRRRARGRGRQAARRAVPRPAPGGHRARRAGRPPSSPST